ncbi:hydroxypyruvate reductase [Peptococcaceae bacterium CEB3]|nr:hydroxypyruvate reductase [Peptococcaceae bacterium CEB3]
MRILVTPTSFCQKHRSVAKDMLEKFADDIVYNPLDRPLHEDEVSGLLEGVDGYIAGLDHITSRVLRNAPSSLKVISRYGAGCDRVDLQAAFEKGIAVTNTPGVNSEAVAELTFGLMLAAARKISFLDRKVKEGEWPRTSGVELCGKTLGIIGLGAIGKCVAIRGRGFSMRVLAYDPFADREYADQNSIQSVSLDELLQKADFISLHVPLNEQTRNLINREVLAGMKKGAILVNTARGGLIDEAAALEALKSGKLGGLGLDAFEQEPPGNSPLFALENVVTTPHTGAHTVEAVGKMGMLAVQNLIDVLSGKGCQYILNGFFGNSECYWGLSLNWQGRRK